MTRLIPFGNRFYAILFERNPELRPLFANDINLQTRMLTSMLSSLVKGLNRTPEISGGLRALGKRHCGYQATCGDYGKVADALLLTLEEFLGDDFTADVREAWIAVFGTISGFMIEGAEGRCGSGRVMTTPSRNSA
jgi:hemoglobin-like flavoprotein